MKQKCLLQTFDPSSKEYRAEFQNTVYQLEIVQLCYKKLKGGALLVYIRAFQCCFSIDIATCTANVRLQHLLLDTK